MKVLVPGHVYQLDTLDGDAHVALQFVSRKGKNYPGNMHAFSGTTCQETLRALIDRAKYLNSQIACAETEAVIGLLRNALYLFEVRAQRVKGKALPLSSLDNIECWATCVQCGHILCAEDH